MGGETRGAVVGGVNIMLEAATTARICLLQALSPVGRCKTFDASGDGYGRGEGFTVALLGWVPMSWPGPVPWLVTWCQTSDAAQAVVCESNWEDDTSLPCMGLRRA